MSRLASVEAQRVMAVLEDMLAELQFLLLVPVEPNKMVADRVAKVSEAGAHMLECLWQTEESWRLINEVNFTGTVRPSTAAAGQVHRQTRGYLKQVIILLSRNPDALRQLRLGPEASVGLKRLVDHLAVVKQASNRRTGVGPTSASASILTEEAAKVAAQVEQLAQELQGKQAEAWVIRKARKDETAILDNLIDRLSAQAEAERTQLQNSTADTEKHFAVLHERNAAEHTAAIATLKAAITTVENQLRVQAEEYAAVLQPLRRKQANMQLMLKETVANYDAAMMKLSEEIRVLRIEQAKDRKRIAELQQHLALTDRNAAIAAEEEAQHQRTVVALQQKLQQAQEGAVVVVQSIWRGYYVRQHLDTLVPTKRKGRSGKAKSKKAVSGAAGKKASPASKKGHK